MKQANDVEIAGGDIQDADLVMRLVTGADDVFHFASQTSHLVSMDAPHRDLAIKAIGAQQMLARQDWIYDWRV